MKSIEYRSYSTNESIVFWKTKEKFGGLSNMAAGFPILINGTKFNTSEALYQACKFPHRPDLQEMIINESSPILAKRKAKPFENEVRQDWMEIRVNVMRWCLQIKLVQNWNKFYNLLNNTDSCQIVEFSEKDDFWGALEFSPGILHGRNVLGRLLMELREKTKLRPEKQMWTDLAPNFPNARLFNSDRLNIPTSHNLQSDFFDFFDN